MPDWLDEIKGLYIRFKDLTAIGVAQIISNAIIGIFWIILATIIDTNEFGEINYFIAIATIAATVSFLGAGPTMLVYTAKQVKIQSTLYFITLVSGAITSLVLFFMFYNLGVSVYVLGFVVFMSLTNELLGRKLYKKYAKFLITQRIFLIIISLSLYYLIGIDGVILGFALSYLPFSFWILRGFRKTKIDFSILRPRLGFMANNYLADLARVLSFSLDKLIVGPLFGFALLGNYSLGIHVLTLLTLVPNIVFLYVLPHDATGKQHKRLKKFTIFVSIILAILTVLLTPTILPIFFPKFIESIEIVQIMSLAIIPRTISMMFISKFLGQEKSKIVIFGSGIYLIVQIPSMILLGELYAINGVALALLLAVTCEAIFLTSFSRWSERKSTEGS